MQARRHGAAEIFGWHCDGGPRAARPRAGHIYAEKLVAAMLQKMGGHKEREPSWSDVRLGVTLSGHPNR